VHHINMDRKDNRTGNLATLCRNCHGVVHFTIKDRVKAGAKISPELCVSVFDMVSRIKTAELSGELSTSRQSEPKAGSDSSQGQRLPAPPTAQAERDEPTRGRSSPVLQMELF
jgi:hypothetical protein